jgi:dTDP-4-amino-4,6-dideoxygalactose transaminase
VPDDAVRAAAEAALADGSWGRYLGPHGDRLREALAAFHDAKHVRLCSSGTAAVEFALRGLGVGPGDEIVLAAYDFEANIKDIFALGATPVLAEVRADDAQLDVELLEDIDSPQIKAVVASHLHGGIVNMPRLREIADRRGWGIVEDVCQSPGAWIAGRRAGMWGDVAVMSFGGSKLLTAGRGGAIVSNRDDVMQRIRLHAERGNELSPLSEIQSAILLPQLAQLDERNRVRHANAVHLAKRLGEAPGVTPLRSEISDLRLLTSDLRPSRGADAAPLAFQHRPAYYKFAAWYDREAFEQLPREVFCAALRAEGFAFWPGFPALHRTHSSRRFRTFREMSNADRAGEQLVVLHHPILLGSEADLDLAAEAIRKVRRHAALIRDAAPSSAYDAFGASPIATR